MIIDNTYFIREISLPTDQIGAELTSYIERFEPEILTKILGYDLYKQLTAGLANTYPEQKWLDLRDGCDYEQDEVYYHWRGLTNSTFESIIANYVFYYYTIYGSQFNSVFGLKQVLGENSTQADYRHKQMRVYNQMVDWISEMSDFIEWSNSVDSETYPNYNPSVIRKVNVFNI
jgi:hypothetical protein